MNCQKCGAQLDENNLCPNCTAQDAENTAVEPKSAENNVNPTATKYTGKGIAGFVLSLVGLLVFAIPCGVIGLVFSILGLKDVEAYQNKGKGLAMSGFIISIIDIALGLIYLAL